MQDGFNLRNGARSIPPADRKAYGAYPSRGLDEQGKQIFLYVAHCKGYAKIGITDNLKTRISAMQGGNPFPIEIIYSIALKKEIAVEAEHQTMLALNEKHWFGDWFKASKSHAKYVAQSVVGKVQQYKKPELANIQDRSILKVPGMKRRVYGPNGECFESCAKAAEFVGISRQAMHMRILNKWQGWRWVEV